MGPCHAIKGFGISLNNYVYKNAILMIFFFCSLHVSFAVTTLSTLG